MKRDTDITRNNLYRKNRDYHSENSLFREELTKMMKYTIEDKNKELIERNDKEHRDRNSSNKEKRKYGPKSQ
jgi:hypothetical protein